MGEKAKYGFREFTNETLENTDCYLSEVEIWQKGCELGFDKKLKSVGKTPWATIKAGIYESLKAERENGTECPYDKSGSRPVRFGLKTKNYVEISSKQSESKSKSTYHERDLHQLLANFANSNDHFKCRVKTIYHEKSAKHRKGKNKWIHPDLVGVYFPFDDYSDVTLDIITSVEDSALKLFSFEMKQEVNFSNLREYYFQAVSNSSWAHEGYLVALKFSKEPDFIDEMRKLNNAFGIGFIELDPEYIEQSQILFTSKAKEKVDWDMVDRIAQDNVDFSTFLKDVVDDVRISKIKGKYDKVLSDEEFTDYVKSKSLVE